MDDMYLDNIDEFVNDQNKIVTYKWLSLTLGVHVNTAKQMLSQYLEQRRKESSGTQLHATYLVSGKCVENGNRCHKISVVREDKLEGTKSQNKALEVACKQARHRQTKRCSALLDTKSKMDVTISVHVYSVQKAELKDSGPLYSTDYDAIKENLKNCNKYSAIRCAAAVPRSSEELRRAQEPVLSRSDEMPASKPELNNRITDDSKATAKQAKGIMGMFANKSASKNQQSSREVKTEQNDETLPAEMVKSKPATKTSAMSNFFGKTAEKKVTTGKPDKAIKEEVEGAQASVSVGVQSSPVPDIKEEQPRHTEPSKTKRSKHSDSEDEVIESQKKKRRRIKKPQPDSSSDDEVIPDSPPVPDVCAPTLESQVKREPVPQAEEYTEGKKRKRRRVWKSWTSVDEEGCIVTEKGFESESYSESEEASITSNQTLKGPTPCQPAQRKREQTTKTNEKSHKKAASVTSKASKQSSIMGFFQKK